MDGAPPRLGAWICPRDLDGKGLLTMRARRYAAWSTLGVMPFRCRSSLLPSRAAHHVHRTPEPDVHQPRVRRGVPAGRDPKAVADLRIAKERPAANHLLALRVRAEGGGPLRVRPVPVLAPLPHVSPHVREPARRRTERPDRGGCAVAVRHRVLRREVPLPGVRAVATVVDERIAPRVVVARSMSEPCGVLPLDLGREPSVLPGA